MKQVDTFQKKVSFSFVVKLASLNDSSKYLVKLIFTSCYSSPLMQSLIREIFLIQVILFAL